MPDPVLVTPFDENNQKLVDQVGRHATEFEDMLSERKAEIEINLRRQLKYQLMSFRESVDEMRPYSPMDKETTRTLAEPRVLVLCRYTSHVQMGRCSKSGRTAWSCATALRI